MRRIRTIRVFVLAIPLALAYVGGTAMADPLVVEAMGLDVWRIGQLEHELRQTQSREAKLDRDLQVVFDRAIVHNLMLEDLLDGRATLVETARRKWELNRHRPELCDFLVRDCAGPSMEARMAHDLYLKAKSKCDEGRPGREIILARLRAEYLAAYGEPCPGSGT